MVSGGTEAGDGPGETMARDLNTMDMPEVEREIARYEAQRAANLSRWRDADVSDSVLSERACDAGIGMARARAEIIRNGGAPAKVLVDVATGRVVAVEPVTTAYGPRWMVKDDDGRATWLPYWPKRADTLVKRGYREEWRMLPALVTCTRTYVPMVTRGPCTLAQADAAPVAADPNAR